MRHIRFTRKRFLVLTTLCVLLPTALLAYFSIHLQREMFSFQSRILHEYALFSVDYAVSEMQDRIRSHEREVHIHFRMVAGLQEFDPSTDLQRIELAYPMIVHAFLKNAKGQTMFSEARSEVSSTASIQQDAASPLGGLLKLGSLQRLLRDQASLILESVLDDETFDHLLTTDDIHFFRGQEEGEPFHLAAFGLFDAEGEPYGVAGFFLKLDYVREKFLADLLEEAISAAEGRFSPNFGRYLTFVVRDHNDDLVYVHQRPDSKVMPDDGKFLSESELWDVLPGWKVRMVYSNPRGPSYRRNLWLSNTLLIGLMASIAVIGIIVSMRFSLRQMELSNVKSHFVSNITHELKTPLAAIRLYTETLMQGRVEDKEQQQKFLGIINKTCVRLTHLINNILDFSRIEMGKKRYAFEPTSIEEIVHDVVDSYAYQLRDKGFEVKVEIAKALPMVSADRDALSQAVINLIDNAVKYSRDRKEVDVTVGRDQWSFLVSGNGRSERAATQGGVFIRIRDHGVGIPSSELQKIFEAFYRVEKGLEHDVKGSGLGLAVVQHIVDAHGGTIEVESHRGSGSTFTIHLPAQQDV